MEKNLLKLESRPIFSEPHWRLNFFGNQPELDIGFLGGNIDAAYEAIISTFGTKTPLVILDSRHRKDNISVFLAGKLRGVHAPQADAVIIEKQKISMCAFYEDCGCIVIESDNYICLAHAGRPEITAEPPLIQGILENWPEETQMRAYIGPMISGKYYQYPDQTKEQLPYGVDTIWKGIRGLEIKKMLIDQLIQGNIKTSDIFDCKIDPFERRLSGDGRWASDQYSRRYQSPPTVTHRDVGVLQIN